MSSSKTRIIHLGHDSSRGDAHNERTMFMQRAVEPGPAFRELFVRSYPAIRRICTSQQREGLAIVALDHSTGVLMGSLWLAAKDEAANSAIIGRHDRADLWLTHDPSLSLRHLAVVLWPARADGEVRFRVLDLRTPTAFQDERGESYESLVAEGPLFLRCGSHSLLFLTTGDGISWPDGAADGWACIPERVYLESEEAEPDRWRRKRVSAYHSSDGYDSRGETTFVHRCSGPRTTGQRLLGASERPLGIIYVSTEATKQELVIGTQAARDGVLLGRYDRCDSTGFSALTENKISRVHLLIVSMDDRLYAIDTASTHGTRRAGEDDAFHITPLEPEQPLLVAGTAAEVRWFPA